MSFSVLTSPSASTGALKTNSCGTGTGGLAVTGGAAWLWSSWQRPCHPQRTAAFDLLGGHPGKPHSEDSFDPARAHSVRKALSLGHLLGKISHDNLTSQLHPAATSVGTNEIMPTTLKRKLWGPGRWLSCWGVIPYTKVLHLRFLVTPRLWVRPPVRVRTRGIWWMFLTSMFLFPLSFPFHSLSDQ